MAAAVEQCMTALQAANKVRMLRAQDCRAMRQRGGERIAADLLDQLPDYWDSARTHAGGPARGQTSTIHWFLLSVWGFGPSRVHELLDAVKHDLDAPRRINSARQVADLTVRERTAISARLRATDSLRRERNP